MSGRPDRDSMIHTYAIRILTTAIAFLALLMVSSVAQAQVLYGSLTGTIADKAGAVIPNVTVTIANQQTGDLRTTKSSGDGIYNFLDMLPGTYTLSIAQSGTFGGYAQKNITIEVNQQVRMDIALQPASVSTQITVTGAPPELQTETAEVDSDISETQISELPITLVQGPQLRRALHDGSRRCPGTGEEFHWRQPLARPVSEREWQLVQRQQPRALTAPSTITDGCLTSSPT
ncbi:MAG: carboxypeptidase-like regulatory domain-containing protein [Terracidiphilus sp.]